MIGLELYNFNAEPISEKKMKEFEDKYNINLPLSYRRYLMSLGYDKDEFYTRDFYKVKGEEDFIRVIEQINTLKGIEYLFDVASNTEYIDYGFIPIAYNDNVSEQLGVFISTSAEYGYGAIFLEYVVGNALQKYNIENEEPAEYYKYYPKYNLFMGEYSELEKTYDSFDEFRSYFITEDEAENIRSNQKY